jgi:hypothetical protein
MVTGKEMCTPDSYTLLDQPTGMAERQIESAGPRHEAKQQKLRGSRGTERAVVMHCTASQYPSVHMEDASSVQRVSTYPSMPSARKSRHSRTTRSPCSLRRVMTAWRRMYDNANLRFTARDEAVERRLLVVLL